ncbi:MAG: protein translocase subunit SecF, partial [Vampirovibrionales bacterium]|nr:protein translocase subunit SecF [Vampirovibrionales bacterium]
MSQAMSPSQNTPSAIPSSVASVQIDYSHLPGAISGPFHVVKQRWLNIAITLLLLVPGLVAMIYLSVTSPTHLPLKLGIDFTGGVMLEYSPQKTITQDQLPAIRAVFEEAGLSGTLVQVKTPASNAHKAIQQVLSIRTKPTNDATLTAVQTKLEATQTGTLTLLQKTAIGPSMAGELVSKGLLALALAYVLIVAYLTIRFQLDFAICAMISLMHDALFVVGAFAILGVLFGTEVDSLFITGILTVVGFSVHDTIVVFDRIRENLKRTAS